MPCKIQIKNNLTDQVSSDTDLGFNKSLEGAKALAKEVNELYEAPVVKFFQTASDFIERDINIPDSLVDRYYNKELLLEAENVQREDAERGGIDYTDDYLFQQEGSTVSSEASAKTIAIVNDFLKRIGVNVKSVKEVVVNGVRFNANAVANLTQKLVQVVEVKKLTHSLKRLCTLLLLLLNRQILVYTKNY